MFVILFALITILILYSSNSANEVFHYGSLRGRTRRPVNLKKWSVTDGYIPILGNKVEWPLVLVLIFLFPSSSASSLLKERFNEPHESRTWLLVILAPLQPSVLSTVS